MINEHKYLNRKAISKIIKMQPKKKGISFKTIIKNTTLGDFGKKIKKIIKKEEDNNEEE